MVDIFKGFGQAAQAAQQKIAQQGLDRAFAHAEQGRWHDAAAIFNQIDLHKFPSESKGRASRCLYEAGKAAIARGDFTEGRRNLALARELGLTSWCLEQRLALLNSPTVGPEFERACQWADSVARYVRGG